MSRITEELIRRKAEHHDGLITDLEEISLHQLELERIEVIGNLCRKLKILYLQNNIIPAIENLSHCTDLRYLNLALNNVKKIEGLGNCELLEKLDLTVNFIDVDTLEESVDHLVPLLHLRDLFLMGNPCCEWPGVRDYVIALLPQLRSFDGKDVTRAERINARQLLRTNESDLRRLAALARDRQGLPSFAALPSKADDADENGAEPWTPEARVAMYRELAEQKEEKERRRREMQPPKRDYAAEHASAVAASKEREATSGILRQMNEGRWEFSIEDEDGAGNVVLRLTLSRFLDTSLIDVDMHPTHVTVVIRSKTFRILWPAEVLPDRGSCQRSQTTGELVITVLKAVKNPVLQSIRKREGTAGGPPSRQSATQSQVATRDTSRTTRTTAARLPKLADLLLQQATSTFCAPIDGCASGAGQPECELLDEHGGSYTPVLMPLPGHGTVSDIAKRQTEVACRTTVLSADHSQTSSVDDANSNVPPLE